MLFADPNANALAYLVLRHLYDGDVVEWPIADDHPHLAVFQGLEQQALVARWDRVWPLHDRYRLTEHGIKAIEAVYRPAGAEQFFDGLRRQNLAPADRRGYLQAQGFDPVLWPLLHDPTTHWTTFGTAPARYQQYIWEDTMPFRQRRSARQVVVEKVVHQHRPPQQLIDLDRDVNDPLLPISTTADYDLS